MTTISLGIPRAGQRVSYLPKRKAAHDKFATFILSLTFLVSFLQYCFERNDLVRLVPVVLLIFGTFLFLTMCPRENRRVVLMAITRPATLGIIIAVAIPPLLSSLYRPTLFPFEYGLMIVVTLIAVRILLSGIGLEEVLVAFFYATMAGMFIVVGSTFSELITSVGSTRYTPFHFDPNRIGLFAVTSIPVQLWFAWRRRRYYVLFLSAFCVFVTLAASSRGSIGALMIGGAVAALLFTIRVVSHSSFALSRNKLIAAVAILCAITAIAVAQQPVVENVGQYLWTKLALDSRDRGLHSGFTGRTNGWADLLDILPKTYWLAGNGYRTTDEDFNFSVDNGYLSSVYELGLVSVVIILAKYAWISYLLAVAYVTLNNEPTSWGFALTITLVVFLANAFVNRVLLGFGDHVSILALFAFVSARQDLLDTEYAVPCGSH